MKLLFIGFLTIVLFYNCDTTADKLPFLGVPTVQKVEVDGKIVEKEVPPTIPPFEFYNQDSTLVTLETFDNQIYIVDFFFTNCPTHCPILTREMLRIHERFKDNEQVTLVSHSIDCFYDSITVLKRYADDIGVAAPKWHFLKCEKKVTSDMAKHYLATVVEEAMDHSPHLVLVDKNKHVRSFCDGTKPKQVDRLMRDIEKLLKEG